MSQPSRTVVWFSAGAASAVATKLALADGPCVIAYTNPGSEHPDNERFISDCEHWFNQEVLRLSSERYKTTWEVWEGERYLLGHEGAPCTRELKRKVRFHFERPTDRQVFGYTVEEASRVTRFREQNPGIDLWCPLIDANLSHSDCLAIVQRAGLELPAMTRLGYDHANCVGCVKGGMGYWNKIRQDFPEVFTRMGRLEREIGYHLFDCWLDELEPTRGNYTTEPTIECSLMCALVEQTL
jgi:hypothetical protein